MESLDNKRTILVVDDVPANLEVLLELLGDAGFEILVSTDGPEAITKTEYAKPDLILLDIMLSGMNGFETCRQIKAKPEIKDIPIIFISALSSNEDKLKGLRMGAVDYVTKPIHYEELIVRINTHLKNRALRDVLLKTNLSLESQILDRTRELDSANQNLKSSNLQLENSLAELERTNRVFQLFVPKPFLHRILAEEYVHLGEFEREHLTILYLDIRSYTNLAEKMSPDENFHFLNNFYKSVEPSISKNSGFVDRFIGDAVTAIFDGGEGARHAVRAAIEIQIATNQFNAKRKQEALPMIHVGIGIHTGDAMIGALGTASRLNSSVIGDPVNLSERLEFLSQQFNAKILISHQTFAEIDHNEFDTRELDMVRVKGRAEPVVLHEVYQADRPYFKEMKKQLEGLLFQGLVFYKAQMFVEAIETFESYLETFPEDIPVQNYLNRCYFFRQTPPSTSTFWNGIVDQTNKLMNHVVRRNSDRLKAILPARVFAQYEEQYYEATIENLSHLGFNLKLDAPISEGEMLLIEFSFTGTEFEEMLGKEKQKALGQVAWASANGESTYCGVEVMTMGNAQENTLSSAYDQLNNQQKVMHSKTFEFRIINHCCVCHLCGRLTLREIGEIQNRIYTLIESYALTALIFDFHRMRFMDSDGIGFVLNIHDYLERYHIRFAMCGLDHIQDTFEMSGFDKVFQIYDNEKLAMEAMA